MPRIARVAPGGIVQHVMNRAPARKRLFRDAADYEAFVNLLAEGTRRVPGVRLLGYCLMPEHWHLLVLPAKAGELSHFVRWVSTMHVRRQRQRAGDGPGEIYQSRFRNFPVQPDAHLLALLRFIESNPRRAKLVRKSEQWRWSSLKRAKSPDGKDLLSALPVRRPVNWSKIVNDPLEQKLEKQVREAIKRGRPFGDPAWVAKTASRLGLEFTLRPHGRPRKLPPGERKRPVKTRRK
jgi:putative transposase